MILPQLLHAVRSDLGIAVLTGPAGVGRTSLLRHMQSQLAHEGRALLCSGASLETPAEVLQTLHSAAQLRAGELSAEMSSLAGTLTRWAVIDQMRKTTEFWGPILLLVDDAQLLSVPVLNELRAFTEEEWHGKSLVRCLISGPLSLEDELARPGQVDFSRRIRCHAFLEPLTSVESLEFLRRHFDVIGGRLNELFTAKALELIAAACDGLPRCLSLLTDESLVVTAARSRKVVDEESVRQALTRLQHLPYAWNASPLRDQDVSDSEINEHSQSKEDEMPTPRTASAVASRPSSSVVEFGGPGVIEIGARTSSAAVSPNLSRSFSTPLAPVAGAVPFAVPSVVTVPAGDSPPDWISTSATVSAPVAGNSTGFEVGHRYQPDALESTDAIEMDDFQSPEESQSGEDFEDAHAAEWLTTNAADHWSPAGVDVEDFDSVSHLKSATGQEVSHRDLALTSNSDTLRKSLPVTQSADFSHRLPVFDRYTWIALGREVPAGTYSVSSALDMKRVCAAGTDPEATDLIAVTPGSLACGQIAVTGTTDQQIMESLSEHLKNGSDGAFVAFKPPAARANVPETWSRSSRFAVDFHDQDPAIPVVGVEQFNIPDMAVPRSVEIGHAVETSGSSAEMNAAENVISESNRRMIRQAVQSTLFSVKASDSAHSHRREVDDQVREDELQETVDTQAQENSWEDGQLIFGAARGANNSARVNMPEQNVKGDSLAANISFDDSPVDADGGSEPEQISLSFAAARAARDESVNVTREAVTPVKSEEKFFTLPSEIKTVDWDSRSSLMRCDGVAPLANSVAELQQEVTAFQQAGSEAAADAVTKATHSASPELLTPPNGEDSIVERSRRRMDFSSAVAAGESVSVDGRELLIPETSGALSLPATSGTTSVSGMMWTASPVRAAEAANSVTGAEQSPAVPRFSQLFTRLRQVRSQVAENR